MPRTLQSPAHVPIVDDAPMNLMQAVDAWLAEDSANGRINSPHTLNSYRRTLQWHAEDTSNRDPRTIGKADVQRTLLRWASSAPSTRAQRHAALTSFYDWCVFNDVRPSNPARQVRTTVVPEPEVRRITRDEAVALLDHPYPEIRTRWCIHLALLIGARRAELATLTKRDLMRPGFIRLRGKGNKVRWVPTTAELQPVIDSILERVEQPGHYVFCRRERVDGRRPGVMRDLPDQPCHPATIHNIVKAAGDMVGLPVDLSPHVLRRAFAENALSHAGQLATQAAMGHASFDTTARYAGGVSLDYVAEQMRGWGYRQLPPDEGAVSPDVR